MRDAKNFVAAGGDVTYIDEWTKELGLSKLLARSAIINDVGLMLYVSHV